MKVFMVLIGASVALPFAGAVIGPMVFTMITQNVWQGAGKPWLQLPSWSYWVVLLSGIIGAIVGTVFIYLTDCSMTTFVESLRGK